MKKFISILLVLCLVIGVSGCQSGTQETNSTDVLEGSETISIGEQVEVNTEYGDFLLTVDNVRKCDWVERNGGEADKYVAVLVECDIENISYEDPYNDVFWIDQFMIATGDDGYIVDTLGYGYDDGLYSASSTLVIPAGSKGRIFVAYNCGIDVQSISIDINGQYVLDVQIEDDESATYLAYEAATELTFDDLTKTSSGSYAYDGLVVSDSEASNIEDGTLYRAMSQQLEGFYMGGETYSMWGSVVVPLVWGFEKPSTWDELKPYVDETKKLIARKQSLGNLMSMFESLSVTEGAFDYVAGEFSFTINDLTKAAEELGITETAFGYILAYLNEYGSTIAFSGNSCNTEVKWYGAERTVDDSIYTVYQNFDEVNIMEIMESGDYDFFYYRTDNGVTEDDYFDVCTKKGIRLGESSDAVIFEYGGELLPYDKSNDIIYYSDIEWDDADDAPQFDLYKYYIPYTVEGYGSVVFYFNEDKRLYMIDFTTTAVNYAESTETAEFSENNTEVIYETQEEGSSGSTRDIVQDTSESTRDIVQDTSESIQESANDVQDVYYEDYAEPVESYDIGGEYVPAEEPYIDDVKENDFPVEIGPG